MNPRLYKNCLITNIVDGDTVDCALDLGFYMHTVQRFRLSHIDAPETHTETRGAGLASKEFLKKTYLGHTADILVEKVGKYGRYVANIYVEGQCVNDVMVREGYAIYKEY